MHRIPPRVRYRPTGAIRFRVGRFGRLIVQREMVEETFTGAPPPPGIEAEPTSTSTVWCDADRGDMSFVIRAGTYVPRELG